MYQKIAIALASILSAVSFSPIVSAASSQVLFEGGAENFVFSASGESWTDTDLFGALKNAMPGDRISEEIIVSNTSSDHPLISLYLRSDPHNDETNPLSPPVAETETVATMSDFLSQLTLSVYNGDTLINSSSADQPGALENYFYLGDYALGESTTLRIELEVPDSLDSQYAHRAGEVDWVFLAEDSSSPSAPTGPDTGFYTPVFGHVALDITALVAAASLAVLLAYLISRKNRSHK